MIEMIGGFESTYLPAHDRDVMESTGHAARWRADLELVAATGVRRLRYPIRWHRVEAAPGRFDWHHTDEVFAAMEELGLAPIVDFVHHTSYPRWLSDGFGDPRFHDAYVRYIEACCERYPSIAQYTLFNEPFSTLFLCGHEAIWPPYDSGIDGLVSLYRNVLPALSDAAQVARARLPHAEHVWVDTCEQHSGGDACGRGYARYANDRRFFVIDAFLGRLDDGLDRPFARDVLGSGGADLADLVPGAIDVLGLDYYAHCQWHFAGGSGRVPRPDPPRLADQIAEHAARYELPVMLTETNLRGAPSDRATWLKYTLEQCEDAAAAGVDVRGYCWFPFIDSADWDSLLYRCEGNIDPVGIYWLDDALERRGSSCSRAFGLAAGGTAADALPAYRFQEPAAGWLEGYLPHMAHWRWHDPPADEVVAEPDVYDFELRLDAG